MKLPLAKMRAMCPHSSAVFLWCLDQVAQTGRNRILTNRNRIGAAIGVPREKTITTALKTLKSCGLIGYLPKRRKAKDGSYAGGYLEIFISGKAKSAPLVSAILLSGKAKSAPPADKSSEAEWQKTPLPLLERAASRTSATATVQSTETCSNGIGKVKAETVAEIFNRRQSNGEH